MKELTIEQKAKAYDKAIERARNLYNSEETSAEVEITCENIFPELKESEVGRIRKALIRFHKNTIEIDGIKGEDIIAWLEKQRQTFTKKDVDDAYLKGVCDAKQELEKQGEQKSFDYKSANIQQKDFAPKVEPKFKVGDWIIRNVEKSKYKYPTKYLIKEIKEHYDCEDLAGKRVLFTFNYIHKHFKLWDISDATDGDVLYDGNNACLFRKKMKDDSAIWVDAYCGIDIEGVFQVNDKNECWCLACDCIPATKEQRDTLLKAMADEDYEFDFEKKELKRVK